MSDVVNLAARMESLTKQYGMSIVFSKETYDRLSDEEKREFQFRKVDEVRVIGKKATVSLFELFAYDWNEYTNLKIQFKDIFERAYTFYKQGLVNKSYILYKYLYRRNPMDKACSVLLQRCESLLYREGKGKYKVKPLPKNWDYVHSLDRK